MKKTIKKDPKNVEAIVNLAHMHGMAYAMKTRNRGERRGPRKSGAWFGYTPKMVPFSKVLTAGDEAKQKAAQAHMSKAVLGFREAVKLVPKAWRPTWGWPGRSINTAKSPRRSSNIAA